MGGLPASKLVERPGGHPDAHPLPIMDPVGARALTKEFHWDIAPIPAPLTYSLSIQEKKSRGKNAARKEIGDMEEWQNGKTKEKGGKKSKDRKKDGRVIPGGVG